MNAQWGQAHFFKYVSIALVCSLLVRPAMADDLGNAGKVVRDTVDTILSILKEGDLSKEEKVVKIEQVIDPVFNFPLMGKLALGKKHWPRLNENEKKEFSGLFAERLKNAYLDKLELFTDEKAQFEPPIKVGTKVHIPTIVVSKGEGVPILYKLHNSREGWRIYDFEVRGVSLVSTYRAQYNEYFRNDGTVAGLLEKMKEKDETE